MNQKIWEQILNQAKEIIESWHEEGLVDHDKYFSIPSQNALIMAIEQEVKKEMERVILNVLNGKDSKINSKKIMQNVKEYFIEKSKEDHEEFIKKHGVIDWNKLKMKKE